MTVYIHDILSGGVSGDLAEKAADKWSNIFKLMTLENVRFIPGIEVK